MLLLQQLALVSAIAHQASFALPLPIRIDAERVETLAAASAASPPCSERPSSVQQVDIDMESGTYNDNILEQPWSMQQRGTITLSVPFRENRQVVLYTLPDTEEGPPAMDKRGMFGFVAKSGISLGKAIAKTGALNIVTNGVSKLAKVGRREVQEEDDAMGAQQLVRRAPVGGEGKTAAVRTMSENERLALKLKRARNRNQNLMLGLEAGLLASTVAAVFASRGAPRPLVVVAPPAHHKSAFNSNRRDANGSDTERDQQLAKRGFKVGKVKLGGLFKKKTAKVASAAAHAAAPAAHAAAAPVAKQPGRVTNVLNNASNVAMLGSIVAPMATSAMGSKTTEAAAPPAQEPPAQQPPAQQHPAEQHPTAGHPAKRSVEHDNEDQALTRRGSVAAAAGGTVTALMLYNMGQQFLTAAMPHLPGAHHHNAAQPQPAVRAFSGYPSYPGSPSYDPSSNVLYKRSPGDDQHPDHQNAPPQNKPGIMSHASTVVTLGFGGQAIQENAHPMYRELKRLSSKGADLISHLLPHQAVAAPAARSLMFQDQDDTDLITRQIAYDDDGITLQVRAVSEAVKAHAGKAMEATGNLVTVSMLASMAGPIVDKAIAMIKGPNHPDNQHHLVRRSLILIEDKIPTSTSEAPLYSSSAIAKSFVNEQIILQRLARLRKEQREGMDEGEILEKRKFNLGKVAGKVMNHKVTQGVLSVVGMAI